MISLGKFRSNTGKSYDCHFIPEQNIVQAVGPLPSQGVGARGVAFKTEAVSDT